MPAARAERAPAKVNLTLRVVGRRADGYHELESLVVFASVGDELTFTRDRVLGLEVRGPTGGDSGAIADNLVFKAARALAERVEGLRLGRFVLSKRLPVAAGLGGGSADAAAALRQLARTNKLALDDPRVMDAARVTGADVPVCLNPQPRMMRGIGEILSGPIALPPLTAVLVNPRVAVPTRDVFARLNAPSVGPAARAHHDAVPDDRAGLLAYLLDHPNDLERPAVALQPVIADVLAAMRGLARCRLARMSGSGATCFGLFDSMRSAVAAAKALRSVQAAWWVRAATLG